MIKVEYLADQEGANRIGSCVSCGKYCEDDPKMVRVFLGHKKTGFLQGMQICLCDKCRRELYEKI